MGTLSYTASVSLDGYVADATGDFQWSGPGDDVFQFHIDRMEAVSAEVLGRNTYLLMKYWDAEPENESWSAAEQEFARRWQQVERIVVSSTLTAADLSPGKIRLVPHLGLAELAQIVEDSPGELEIFGPTTASDAIRAGMVTDFRFFVVAKMVGGGLRALPEGVRLDATLVEQRAFGDVVYVHYRAR